MPRTRKGSLCLCVTGSSDPELFVSEVIVSRMGPGTYRVLSKHGIGERSLIGPTRGWAWDLCVHRVVIQRLVY